MDERRPHALVEWLVAALAGAALLLLAGWLVPPSPVPFPGHGERFADMAAAPFAFASAGDTLAELRRVEQELELARAREDAAAAATLAAQLAGLQHEYESALAFPHRILWPLLAHAAGWAGVRPVAFSQACSGALLALVFWFCRRRGAGWLGALLVAAATAVSGAVLVYQPMACYSDSLVLAALVLLVHFAARPVLFWAIVLVAALAHELIFFFAPWLVWLRLRAGNGSWTRDGAGLLAALALYGGWRLLLHALAPVDPSRPGYGVFYYVTQNFWVPWAMPLMWALWALVVVVGFGPLLVIAIAAWRRGALAMGGRAGPWLYLACMLSLMLLAYDVMRFAAFWHLPVVLGGLALVRWSRGRLALAAAVALAGVTYRWQHPVASEQGGRAFTEVSGHVRELLIARMQAAGSASVPHFGPGDAWAFTADLLARTGPTFAAAALAWLAAIALGLLLARAVRPRLAAGG